MENENKNEKEKNKAQKIIIAIVLLLMILLLGTFIGSTYSKYKSIVRGEVGLPIASWSFLVNGAKSTTSSIELFNTYNLDTLSEGKIAPGTSGSFNILIDATGSDVGINYKVLFFNIIDEPDNMVYTYNGQTVTKLNKLQDLLKGTINAKDTNKQKKLTINWKWEYETGSTADEISVGDQIDTSDSKAVDGFTFDINIVGEQQEPIEVENNVNEQVI